MGGLSKWWKQWLTFEKHINHNNWRHKNLCWPKWDANNIKINGPERERERERVTDMSKNTCIINRSCSFWPILLCIPWTRWLNHDAASFVRYMLSNQYINACNITIIFKFFLSYFLQQNNSRKYSNPSIQFTLLQAILVC